MQNETATNNEAEEYHIPVLLQECIDALNIQPSGTYVDCTFGGGGHSAAILNQLSPEGRLFVFDQDEDAKANAPADDQIDVPERGFSTRYDAPLDMRMDQSQKLTAAAVLNTYSELQLHKIFERYGSVTNAKSLAAYIVETRRGNPFTGINAFKKSIYNYVKGNPNKYLAQVFQALRMEVNEEEESLKELLLQSKECLATDGRLAIITFHSVEDRLVKNYMKTGITWEVENEEEDLFGRKPVAPLRMLHKKPIVATEAEQKINPRSRSAKLRVAEKK